MKTRGNTAAADAETTALTRIDKTVGAGEFTDQRQIAFQEIEAGKLGKFRPGDLREIEIDDIAAKTGHEKKSQLHLDDAGIDVVIAGKLFGAGNLDGEFFAQLSAQ